MKMLERIMLGSTDIEVSRLGLGTVKLGRNQAVKYPSEFQLPSDQQVSDLLDTALELGINLVDTAPAYGSSEERLGKLINDRERWVISTKVGEEFQDGKSTFDFSAAHTRKSIERSLARLNTHYLDIVLIHSNGDDRKILESSGCLPVLRELKSDNVINAIGISTKSLDGGLLALDLVDLVMVTYNTTEQEQAPVLEKG